MGTDRYRPIRPVAALGAVFVAAVLLFGLARMLDGGAAREGWGLVVLVLWCVAGGAVIATILRWGSAGRRAPNSTARGTGDDDRSR